jgi:hypothetical protein
MPARDNREERLNTHPMKDLLRSQASPDDPFKDLTSPDQRLVTQPLPRDHAYKEQKKELLIKTLGAWVDLFVTRWLDNRVVYNKESHRWIRGEVASIMERTSSHLSDTEREGRDTFFVTRVLDALSQIENNGECIDRIVEAIENPFVELCAQHYRAGDGVSVIRKKITDIREENFVFTYLARSIKGVLALEVYSQLPTVDREAFIESSVLRDPLARPRQDLHLPVRSRSLYDANIDNAVRTIFREQSPELLSLLRDLPPTGVPNRGQPFRPSERHAIPRHLPGGVLNDLQAKAYDAFVDSPLSGAPFHIMMKDILKRVTAIASAHGKPAVISWSLGGLMRDQMKLFAKNQLIHSADAEMERRSAEDAPRAFTVYTELSRYFRLRGETSEDGKLAIIKVYREDDQWRESREEIGVLVAGEDLGGPKMYPTIRYRAFFGGTIATKFRLQLEETWKEISDDK